MTHFSPPITSGRTLDHAAKVYDLLSPLMLFGQEKKLSLKALDLLELTGTEKVLDIGCGTGTLTIEAAKLLTGEGSLAIGLDAAPKMIEVARGKAAGIKNIRFDVGIGEQLTYPDGYFDRIVSTFFFHHINFELKKRTVGEMYRVLKPGGSAVVVDVDIPTTIFGEIAAWSGYFLFRQDEIRENIYGRLREAMAGSSFSSWRKISTHQGYISIFKLVK